MPDEALPLRRIRQRRRAKSPGAAESHSLASYAKRLGVTEGHLSRIERGLVPTIPVELAWGLHRVYGVPLKSFDRGVGRVA
jgi:transcriptional regulator with XRE-family HTH domain